MTQPSDTPQYPSCWTGPLKGWRELALIFALMQLVSLPGITTAANLTLCDEAGLRSAVAKGGTINILSGCDSIQLTEPLVIENNTTISAAASLRLTASSLFPLFIIKPGITLSLTRIHLGDYDPNLPSSIGRAIHNDGGTLQALSCSFRSARGIGESDPGMGGAIFARDGSIRLQRCALEYNTAASAGGAIYATNCTVSLTECSFNANSAGGNENTLSSALGGAIAQMAGELKVTDTTLAYNVAHGPDAFRPQVEVKGGALFSTGELTVRDSIFASNSCSTAIDANLASQAIGGAIYSSTSLGLFNSRLMYNGSSGSSARGGALANEGSANLNGNLFASNRCHQARRTSQGGAIHNSGVLALSTTTLVANEAMVTQSPALRLVVYSYNHIYSSDAGGATASGGALHNAGVCNGTNSTFIDNLAYASTTADPSIVPASALGGAVFNERGSSTWVHTTLAANRCGRDYFDERTPIQGAGLFHASGTTLLMNSVVANNSPGGNCFGAIADGGGNACSDDSCPFVTGYVNQPIEFEAKTVTNSTLIPKSGSVLIDGGISSACTPQDQLGRRRPLGSACDIGAVEWLNTGATPSTRFLQTKPRVLESAEEIVIIVQHAGNATGSFRVNYETRDGTATEGKDYTATSGELLFPLGVTLAHFTVKLLPDSLTESNETIHLLLSDPVTGAVVAEEDLTIVEEEPRFRFTETDSEAFEGNQLAIQVIREGPIAESTAVNYRTIDATAREGQDYVATQGTLTFAPGETHRTFTIETNDDASPEETETLGIELIRPSDGVNLANRTVHLRDVSTCNLVWLQGAVERGGLIRFECDHVYVLSNTLVISKDTILDASGHNVVLDGDGAVRLIEVRPGVTLSLTNLTLTRGRQLGTEGLPGGRGGDAYGAAIFNDRGTVQALQCRFVMNSVQGGEGVLSVREDLAVPGGDAFGAAIFSRSGALSLEQCSFLNNRVAGGTGGDAYFLQHIPKPAPGGTSRGGAIYGTNTTQRLKACRFERNACVGGSGGLNGSGFSTWDYGASRGGALYLTGEESTLVDGEFVENHSLSGTPATGGAIHLESGALILRGTTFSKNSALGGNEHGKYGLGSSGMGGGIFSQGQLSLSECKILGNTAFAQGVDSFAGGVYSSATAWIDRCYFESNRAFTSPKGGQCWIECMGFRYGRGYGGALFNTNKLVLLNSSFVDNTAQGGLAEFVDLTLALGSNGFGGALLNHGLCNATNNTFVRNSARGGPINGGDGFGGGICNLSGDLVLNHATFANNQVSGAGGNEITGSLPGNGFGSQLFNGAGNVTLANTILADSSATTNCVGTIVDAGGNLSSDLSCQFTSGLNGVDPRLGPLAFYGGTVPVVALLPGSAAIDAGIGSSCPPTDQRGFPRPSGQQCDIGAFESHGELAAESLFQEWADESHLRLVYVGAAGATRLLQSSDNLQQWSPWGSGYTVGDQGWFEAVVPVQSQDTLRAFRVVAP
jgi:predicted outer membrane repeat protein